MLKMNASQRLAYEVLEDCEGWVSYPQLRKYTASAVSADWLVRRGLAIKREVYGPSGYQHWEWRIKPQAELQT